MIAKQPDEKKQKDMLKKRDVYEMIKDHAADIFSKQFGVKRAPIHINYDQMTNNGDVISNV